MQKEQQKQLRCLYYTQGYINCTVQSITSHDRHVPPLAITTLALTTRLQAVVQLKLQSHH